MAAWDVLITPSPIGERGTVMSVSVYGCVCVCLSVHDHIFGSPRQIFSKLFVHVNYDRESVLLWRRMICYVLPVIWMTSYLFISLWSQPRLYNRLYNRGCTTGWVNYTPTSCRGVPRKTNFRFFHKIAFACEGYDHKCKCCA